MLKKVLVIGAIVIGVLLVVISMRPSEFRVSRSTAVAASPEPVFALVNNHHHWESWSPWGKIDSAMKHTFEGADSGVGAVYAWSGNMDVGEGRSTIVESRPTELIRFKLEFVKPMSGVATAEFTFKPEGDRTLVTWSMFGENYFLAKAVSLFMDCDKMIGDQFEIGLTQLKSVVETEGILHPTKAGDEHEQKE